MQSIVAHTESAVAPVAAAVSARDRARRSGEGDTAVYALGGVSLDIAAARITAVMGSSGSGKSRPHVLAGVDVPGVDRGHRHHARLGHRPGELSGGQQRRVFLPDGEMVRDAGALSAYEVAVAMGELSAR